MAIEDNTFPQSGDPDDAVRFAQLIGHGNLTNHVETGLNVDPDFSAGTASVSPGVCYIGVSSGIATSDDQEIESLGYAIQVGSSSVSLLSGETHIAVVPTYSVNDTNSVETFGELSEIPDDALRIAVVDSSAESVTLYNRAPIAEFESVTVQNGVQVNGGSELLATENWVSDAIASSIYTDADAITAIDGEISIAASTVSSLDSAVDSNSTEISSNNSDISTLQSNKLDSSNYTPVVDVDAEVSVAATSVSGLDSAVDSNDSDISNLQSTKFDASNYTPESDTHTRYADSEALGVIDGEISLAASSVSGLDSAVDSNDTDISSLQSNKLDSSNYTPVTDVDAEVSVAASSVSGLDSAVDSNDTDISTLQSNKFDASDYNPESDTHTRYSDSEAISAIESSVDISNLQGGAGTVDQIIATDGASLRYTTVDELRTDPPIDSVFGRTGTVTANSGDYTHSQIDGVSSDDHHSKYTDSEALSAVESNISAAALTVSGLDAVVSGNTTDISNLQSNKLDSSNYTPESDTHSRYTDSEALGAIEAEISVAALTMSGLDSAVDSNDSDISNLQSNKLNLSGGTMTGAITLSDGSTAASQSWVNSNADVPNANYADSAGDADTVDGLHGGEVNHFSTKTDISVSAGQIAIADDTGSLYYEDGN